SAAISDLRRHSFCASVRTVRKVAELSFGFPPIMPNGVSANQPHQPVTHQADPEVYGQSPIDLVKSVLRTRRQEPLHAEVNGVSRQHGDQGLPERALEQPYRGR